MVSENFEERMADTIQKYKDYVMTGFMKSVVPIVVEKARGVSLPTCKAANTWTVSLASRW
jgi:hypothetical protein